MAAAFLMNAISSAVRQEFVDNCEPNGFPLIHTLL
jgi:hypothetical protein